MTTMIFKPLPKLKKGEDCCLGVSAHDEGFPTIWMRASKEQIDQLEVGKEATLAVKGKITSVEISSFDEEKGTRERNEFRIEVTESAVYSGTNEFEDLLDE